VSALGALVEDGLAFVRGPELLSPEIHFRIFAFLTFLRHESALGTDSIVFFLRVRELVIFDWYLSNWLFASERFVKPSLGTGELSDRPCEHHSVRSIGGLETVLHGPAFSALVFGSHISEIEKSTANWTENVSVLNYFLLFHSVLEGAFIGDKSKTIGPVRNTKAIKSNADRRARKRTAKECLGDPFLS